MPDNASHHSRSSAPLIIHTASTPGQFSSARTLFQEYASSIGVDLCFQGFAHELTMLEEMYAPPDGCLLLAYAAEEQAGCVALRKIDPHVSELKRMYVRPAFRGRGVGLALASTILQRAQAIGYHVVRLDTLETMSEARRIYEHLGFQPCAPYYPNPLSGVIYMEKILEAWAAER